MVKLSLLIPTLVGREAKYENLMASLRNQYCGGDVEIATLKDNKEATIGEKRNELLRIANGEYVAEIDDDDRVSNNYIRLLMEGIDKGVDCCSLKGIITVNGKNPDYFEHSIKYNEYRTDDSAKFELGQIKHFRYPNHLSCIRADVAKKFKFPKKNFSEDSEWAMMIHKSGLLKTEHFIDEVIYYYDYISK